MSDTIRHSTVGYLCPACGGGVLSVVGIEALEGELLKLRCDCGKSEMLIRRQQSKIVLDVPCVICGGTHQFTYDRQMFLEKQDIRMSCPYTNAGIAAKGEQNLVKAALAEDELNVLKLMEEAGVSSLDAFHTDFRAEGDCKDPVRLNEILFVLKDMDEAGDIRCRCRDGEGGPFSVQVRDESVSVSCERCGASREIFVDYSPATESFLSADKITLS
ncbi:MAG: hypothetical protein IJR83_07550 [Clostridia bacterium]|nr:hypothetical protein [Clostridia bacterium]